MLYMKHFDMCCIYIVCVFLGRSPTAQCIAFGKQKGGNDYKYETTFFDFQIRPDQVRTGTHLIPLMWYTRAFVTFDRGRQQPPGAARSRQEPPGAARSRQEPPGAARSRQEPPGAARSRQEPPKAARSRQEAPGTARSHKKPPGAARSRQEPS